MNDEFEAALKNLLNGIDSDIIDITIFCNKKTKNIEVTINKKEKIKTIFN